MRLSYIYDGPWGDLTSPRYRGRNGRNEAAPLSEVPAAPLELPFDVPISLAASAAPEGPESDSSHERYAGGRRPEAERCNEGTGPPSSCRSSSSSIGEPGWLDGE